MKHDRLNGILLGLSVAALVFTLGTAQAEDLVGDPYALNVCPVSGEPLGSMGDPLIFNHDGREIRFCCSGCEPMFKAEPAKYLAKLDELMTKEQEKFYPLTTCVVSGEELDENAESRIVNNRLMKFASAEYAATAAKTPEKFIAKLDEAVIERQSKNYPLKTCIVSGQELGSMGDPIKMVVANRLIELCCAGCVKTANKYPAKMIALIDGKEFKEGSDTK